jgi:hypothetical protein
MTTGYRAMCAELVDSVELLLEMRAVDAKPMAITEDRLTRARALLAQPVAEGPKPVVDYSRVPEIATEAQIRSAAQYLVKKRNCDGDLIPAIEYAIARWGNHPESPDSSTQPIPLSERLPGPEDCDEQGRCWWHRYTPTKEWHLQRVYIGRYTHWLPANALPTPEATVHD